MFPTVQQQELKDGVSSDKEKTKLANALRRAANQVSSTRVQLTTAATGAFVAIWTSDEMPVGTVWAIEFYVFYRAAAGTPSRGRWWKSGLFYREPAGVVTQESGTGVVVANITSAGVFDTRFLVIGNTIAVQVTDDGATTADWDAQIVAREVT